MSTRTTIASDDFNRADGGLGSNWTTIATTTAPAIVSNTIHDQGAAASSGAFWNANFFPSDQWAQITMVTQEASAGSQGVALRVQENAYSGYLGFYDAGTGNLRIRRVDAGAATNLVNVAYTFVANDVIRLEAIGTQLRLYINDVLKLATYDTTYRSGPAGYIGFRQAADNSCDDWSGGSFDITSAGGATPVGIPIIGSSIAGTLDRRYYPYMFGPWGLLRSPSEQWRSDATFPVEVYSDAANILSRRRRFAHLLQH